MAKYASNAKAILLNNGKEQLLPVSKAKLIELAKSQQGQFGDGVVDVEGALSYLLAQDATNLAAANKHTDDSIAALDSSIAARTGYVLSGITEVDGKLTAYTETWLDASIVSYNGKSNVNTALTDIYGKLAAISGAGTGSIQDQIKSAIDALDVTEIKDAGKAIVSVSETDGKIAATAGNVDAQYVDANNTSNKFKFVGENATAEKVSAQATLEQLQSEINAAVGDAARYTVSKITENLPANVGARYQLMQSIGGAQATAVEAAIDIPADSTLKEVYLGSATDTVDKATGTVTKNTVDDAQSMNFVHKLADGTYSITHIDISKFFTQSERGAGLVKTGATLAVGLDNASENFLSVEADGIKLSGVQAAIDTAANGAKTYADQKIADLDSSVGQEYQDSETAYVITGVTQENGELTSYFGVALDDAHVKTTTFDSTSELYKLLGADGITGVTNIHDALNKIAGKVSEGAAAAVTEVVGDNDNTYVKVTAAKSNNTVTLTVDDSALGNVAKLHYDELPGEVESVTILGANPTA